MISRCVRGVPLVSQRRFTERRVNANVEWCSVIGQCHGNSVLFDVGVDAAFSERPLHKVPVEHWIVARGTTPIDQNREESPHGAFCVNLGLYGWDPGRVDLR